jgi:hypothetical protein
MKKFRVFLRGENFFLRLEGEARRYGFYTTRFVEAEDENAAEQRAIELLRQHGPLRDALLNDTNDPPMLFTEEIEELASFEDVENPSPGLAFYEDQPTEH